jgi:dTDP-glucose 4,6-dehydratase
MASAFTPFYGEAIAATDMDWRVGGAERSASNPLPEFVGLAIPEVRLVYFRRGGDLDGQPHKSDRQLLVEAGIDVSFVEETCSVLAEPGTISGLHFQDGPKVQAKLVRVAHGSIFSAVVDLRPDSPTFGRHVSAVLTATGGAELFVPMGFAHGFCTLEADTEVICKTSECYSPALERGIAFDDPELSIDWPLDGREPVVAGKDRSWPTLRQLQSTDARAVGKKGFPQQPMRVLVTGGAGFIGSAVVRRLIARTGHTVLNLDTLNSAASASSLASVSEDPRYELRVGDICDTRLLHSIFREFRPQTVIHLAAETRSDRPIEQSEAFLRTNAIGTLRLLQAAGAYFESLDASDRARFRFQHVSTDVAFGSHALAGSQYLSMATQDVLSPYLASKAAADLVVRAWGNTCGVPVVLVSCTEVYGPFQSLHGLVPRAIVGAATERDLSDVMGDDGIHDWLFVDDLAEALQTITEWGLVGNIRLVAGAERRSNRQVVTAVADLVEELAGPLPDGRRRRDLIAGPGNMPSRDYRYILMEQSDIEKELGWHPARSFESGLRETVSWYLENEGWWRPLLENGGTKRDLMEGHQRRSVTDDSARS